MFRWVGNILAAAMDVVDLYWNVSELKDIPITDADREEQAYYSSMASSGAGSYYVDENRIAYDAKTGECLGHEGKLNL